MNIGIVGYGKMGRLREERLLASGRANVVAICDPYSRPEGLPPHITVYEDWRELVAAPRIDAIFVGTANAFNKPITIAAMQAGKHVFCEKPPALTAADMLEVIKIERVTR